MVNIILNTEVVQTIFDNVNLFNDDFSQYSPNLASCNSFQHGHSFTYLKDAPLF